MLQCAIMISREYQMKSYHLILHTSNFWYNVMLYDMISYTKWYQYILFYTVSYDIIWYSWNIMCLVLCIIVGNRKRIPAPMWLQAGGPKRHSDMQIRSGENLNHLKRKYKQSLCLYCAGKFWMCNLFVLWDVSYMARRGGEGEVIEKVKEG